MEEESRNEETSTSKSQTSSHHLQTPKNEDAYEISIPYEESGFAQQEFFNQSEQNFDDSTLLAETSTVNNNSFMAITNLRTQLQISLEKNSWLQKRIEDLEEEKDFLRCQLDRFIFSTRSQGLEQRYESREYNWRARRKEDLNEQQKTGPLHQSMRRRTGPASVGSSKSQIPSPSSSQLASMNILFNSAQSQSLLQNHINNPPSTAARGGRNTARRGKRPGMTEIGEHRSQDSISFLVEPDDYLEQDSLMERRDLMSQEEVLSNAINPKRRQVKRRKVFRPLRERQRVKDAAGVLFRYKKILLTYQRLKNMSKAFQINNVDRNTVASTTPIAELLLVAPEKVADVGEFDSSKEKLLDYARRCYLALDEETQIRIQALKKNNMLLPIAYRFRR